MTSGGSKKRSKVEVTCRLGSYLRLIDLKKKGFGVWGLGSRVWVLRFGVWDVGFRV